MALVTTAEILKIARREKYGIPCVLGGNMEMVLGQVKAAEETKSPLILCFNEAITSDIPMEMGYPLIIEAARSASVPIAPILDHGTEFDSCVRAVHCGSPSIMFDGSHLDYEENIRITQELRKLTTPLGVALEAELGAIGGSVFEYKEQRGVETSFTDPKQAEEFVERTGIDQLAISFGNVHGRYSGDNQLDLDRIRAVHERVSIPLVMHGGSGLGAEDYQAVIAAGISKINYYTAQARGAAEALWCCCDEEGKENIYHKIISRSIEFFYEDTKKVLKIMGTVGRAG